MVRGAVLAYGLALTAWWATAWIPKAKDGLVFVSIAALVVGLTLACLAFVVRRGFCPECGGPRAKAAPAPAEPQQETTRELVDRLERERAAQAEHALVNTAARTALAEVSANVSGPWTEAMDIVPADIDPATEPFQALRGTADELLTHHEAGPATRVDLRAA